MPRSGTGSAPELRLKSIERCYGVEALTLGERRPAPSELLRNVNALHGATSDRIWAWRQFAYLDPLKEKAIGFLHIQDDLRSAPPLFEAYLARPERLSSFHVIEGNAPSQLFGVELPCQTSAYFVPHESMVGFCAQASCQMALANMASYGAVSLGPLDITRIALGCDTRDLEGAFDPVGLTPPQMRKVLGSTYSGVNAQNETFAPGEPTARICDLLAGYVLSNCPVIVSVDALAWLESLTDELDPGVRRDVSSDVCKRKPGARRHAIVVIGCSRDSAQSIPDFVVHDSLTSPYLRVRGSSLVKAARRWTVRKEVQWVAAVPKAVRTGAMSLSRVEPAEYEEELSRLAQAGSSGSVRTRLLPRLYRRDALVSSYIDEVLGFVVEPSTKSDIESVLARRCGGYVWAFERREKTWITTTLFDASRDAPPYQFGFLSGTQLSLRRSVKGKDAWQLRRRKLD